MHSVHDSPFPSDDSLGIFKGFFKRLSFIKRVCYNAKKEIREEKNWKAGKEEPGAVAVL